MLSSLLKFPSLKQAGFVTVSVEWHESFLKLAAVRKETGYQLLIGYRSLKIKGTDEAGAFIKNFVETLSVEPDRPSGRASSGTGRKEMVSSELKVSSPNVRFVISVPRQVVTVRFLELPSVDFSELKRMARYQAISTLPFSEDELISDILVMKEDLNSGHSNLFLAVARKDLIEPYLELFRKIGRYPEGFVLSCFGLAEFLKGKGEERRGGDRRGSRKGEERETSLSYMHVDFGNNWVEMDLIRNGNLVSSRTVPLNFKEASADRVIKECRQTITSSGLNLNPPPIQGVVVSGQSNSFSENCRENIRKEFKVPVEAIYLSAAPFFPRFFSASSDAVPFLKNIREGTAPVSLNSVEEKLGKDFSVSREELFSSVVGAAFSGGSDYLNLLPEEVIRKQVHQRKHKEMAAAAFWLGLWLIVWIGFSGWKIFQKKSYLFSLESQIGQLEPDAKKVSGIFKKLAFLRSQMDFSASPLETLRELHQLVPSEIMLNSVSYDSDGPLILQGTAYHLSQVMEFVNSLERSDLFSKAELRASSMRKIRDTELVDFQVQCLVESGGSPG